MVADLALPLSMLLGVTSFGLIALWYVAPALKHLPRHEALIPLLLPHAFRYVGMAFLVPGVTAHSLDPRFADPAAYGDLLVAVLALVAVVALRSRWMVAIPLVWLFNVVGTADLVTALYRGALYNPDGYLGATFFIPAVFVPALFVLHVLVFWLLLRPDPAARPATAGRPAPDPS